MSPTLVFNNEFGTVKNAVITNSSDDKIYVKYGQRQISAKN